MPDAPGQAQANLYAAVNPCSPASFIKRAAEARAIAVAGNRGEQATARATGSRFPDHGPRQEIESHRCWALESTQL